jgi:hypothetical protein
MTQTAATPRPLTHNVFFSLHDHSPAACQRLLAACHQYLAPHAGIVYFGCGARATDLRREVNDLDFDVSLHIVFTDRAAHDAYQESGPHAQFITENKANWRKVRVFDSLLAPAQP